jgi:hypothetical protein
LLRKETATVFVFPGGIVSLSSLVDQTTLTLQGFSDCGSCLESPASRFGEYKDKRMNRNNGPKASPKSEERFFIIPPLISNIENHLF